MRKIRRVSVYIPVFYFFIFRLFGQDNLSPLVRSLNPLKANTSSLEKEIQTNCGEFCIYSEGRRYLSGTLSWSTKPDLELLAKQGIKTRSIFPFGATVLIPIEKLGWLAAQPWLSFLDLDQAKSTAMREQRRDLKADAVQEGSGDLDKAYNGENVVIAVIDQGFDYTHPAFWDSTYQTSHILMVWDQMASSGTPPSGYSYGKLVQNSALKAEQGDGFHKSFSHGTHVAAIAAGSGYPTPERSFRGIAPKASLILISSDLSDSKVSDGLQFAYNYAKSKNLPLSVNMSFGGYGSAMDGTAFLDKAIGNQVGAGCLVSVAMGNEGERAQFATFTTTGTQTSWKSIITASGDYPSKPLLQVWAPQNSLATVRMGLIRKSTNEQWTTNAYSANSSSSFSAPAIGNWNFKFNTYSAYSGNNNRLWNIELVPGDADYLPFVEVISTQTNETIQVLSPYMDLSNRLSNQALTGFSKGDTVSNGRSPGMTSSRAIGVGAHVAKDTVYPVGKPRLIDKSVVVGQLCKFSGRGPSFSGLVKPDISAPGYLVSSGISSADLNYPDNANTDKLTEYKSTINNKTYRYYLFAGTSMATPMVTGSLALLMQANPLLTPEQAKEILSETARKDAFTKLAAGEKNNRFGFGKLDLYQAMLKTLNITPTTPAGSKILLFPNPASSTVNLVLPSDVEFTKIRMLDILGRLVFKNETLSGSFLSLSVDHVSQGQYMLQIQTNKGEILQRLLINR